MRDLLQVKRLMRAKPDIALKNPKKIKSLSKKAIAIGLGFPLLLLFLYFYVIGRDRYFVQSDVVVRKAAEATASSLSLGSILSGGNQQSIEDARFLRTYLESPQVLEDLEKTFSFRTAYAKRFPDFYPGVTRHSTREQLYDAFRRQIRVSLDETSGQITIQTLAFDPGTALRFNRFLVDQAEFFVNKLNQDVYKQQIGFAKQQVELNYKRVQDASKKLKDFQAKNKILSATLEGSGNLTYINALEAELASKRVKLATLRRQFRDPRAPEIESVNAEVQELQAQIKEERAMLVSPEGKDLTEKVALQTELEGNLAFASDLYKASITSAEKTRVDSLQQQRFMAVLSKPLKPEEPWQYWRHKGFFTALAVVFVGFSLTRFLLGMADSHRN
jgi:capsular polysaccharide transport system permease protein